MEVLRSRILSGYSSYQPDDYLILRGETLVAQRFVVDDGFEGELRSAVIDQGQGAVPLGYVAEEFQTYARAIAFGFPFTLRYSKVKIAATYSYKNNHR